MLQIVDRSLRCNSIRGADLRQDNNLTQQLRSLWKYISLWLPRAMEFAGFA